MKSVHRFLFFFSTAPFRTIFIISFYVLYDILPQADPLIFLFQPRFHWHESNSRELSSSINVNFVIENHMHTRVCLLAHSFRNCISMEIDIRCLSYVIETPRLCIPNTGRKKTAKKQFERAKKREREQQKK